MNKSLIFTDAEMQAIDRRKQGDKSDKTGIFFGRIKPKIEEILNFWFPEKKTLQKLIAPASRKNNKKEVLTYNPTLDQDPSKEKY